MAGFAGEARFATWFHWHESTHAWFRRESIYEILFAWAHLHGMFSYYGSEDTSPLWIIRARVDVDGYIVYQKIVNL
jgi:hypothetical protein